MVVNLGARILPEIRGWPCSRPEFCPRLRVRIYKKSGPYPVFKKLGSGSELVKGILDTVYLKGRIRIKCDHHNPKSP